MRAMKRGEAWRCAVAVVAIVSGTSLPADAQESRAAERERQQNEKTLTPNVPTGGERVFEWVERYLTSPEQWYVTFGGLMPGAGLASGGGYRGLLGERARFNAKGAWSIRDYRLAEGTITVPLAGNGIDIAGHARWREGGELPFFGVGGQSSQDSRTHYFLRTQELGTAVTVRPLRWLSLTAGTAALSFESGSGAGRFASIESLFDASTAPGLLDNTDYLHSQGTVAFDSRESDGYTRRGGYYAVGYHHYDDRGSNRYAFRQVDVDARQFIPLVNEHFVIAVRGALSTTDHDADQNVPFFLLPSLGSSTTLRGYRDDRFRDRHALLLSGEYRWIPGRLLDMALFVDAGKVTSHRRDLDFKDLNTSFGIGARFHATSATVLRVETARSDEGIRVHFTFGKSF